MATLKIRRAQQTLEILNVDLAGTVAQLKTQIATTTSIQPASQRLVFGGRVLEDGNTLVSYGIAAGATLHMVVKDSAPAAAPAPVVAPSFPSAAAGGDSSGLSGPLSPGPAPASAELRAFMQQIASSPQGQMMMAAALQNPQILLEFARQNPQIAPLLQEALSNPAALMEMFGPQRAPGEPFISRDIFSVAIRCLNGEPVPEEYQLDEEGEEGDEGEPMDLSGEAPARPGAPAHHEFISREQIAHAIAFAQGRAGPVPPPSTAPAAHPAAAHPAPRPAAPPAASGPADARQRYSAQLAQLTAMGFPEDMCLRALQMADGDVNSAIAILLG